ncbi:MAG: hypothetical protein LBH51_05490 [Treponema sp.]|jgi:response regulator RpfG family c-di-GMP phosphodiesterase|nr:hypothetical protein [Treponema sp.]
MAGEYLKRPCLLVVDGSRVCLDACWGALGQDYDLVACNGGEAAFRMLETAGMDAVIVGRDMDGIGYLYAKGQGVHKEIPALKISWNMGPDEEELALFYGARGYLKAPFGTEDLREKIEILLGCPSSPTRKNQGKT